MPLSQCLNFPKSNNHVNSSPTTIGNKEQYISCKNALGRFAGIDFCSSTNLRLTSSLYAMKRNVFFAEPTSTPHYNNMLLSGTQSGYITFHKQTNKKACKSWHQTYKESAIPCPLLNLCKPHMWAFLPQWTRPADQLVLARTYCKPPRD